MWIKKTVLFDGGGGEEHGGRKKKSNNFLEVKKQFVFIHSLMQIGL